MNDEVLKLISEEYTVLDGGLGTLLYERGLSSAELPEEWNNSHPDVLRGIHLDYLISGAQVIETNTFGASFLKLESNGKQGMVKELNERGAALAFDALKTFRDMGKVQDDKRFISGSVGPTGKILEMGVTRERVEKSYAEQSSVLADAGVDLFTVETMLDLREAEIAVKTLKSETGLPVIASVVFNKTKKGEARTLFGNTVRETVSRLFEAGADAVGTNCGLIEEYLEVIREMRSLTDKPLMLYPNAGPPKLKNGRTVFDQTPEYLITFLDESIEAGATIIGGCCGTAPEYIRLVSEKIKGRKR